MSPAEIAALPDRATVRIEVPRGSFVKRRPDGSIDFVSPLPCPYNYGSVVGTVAPDGDPLDALVLGEPLPVRATVDLPVRGVIGFVDAGQCDPKLVCSATPLTRRERAGIERFFARYGVLKRIVNLVRRERGRTACTGWLR